MSDQAMAAPICEHYWAWVSPAGSSNSAHICMLCHEPDARWLNTIVEIDPAILQGGTMQEYRGWFGRYAKRRCPHSLLVGIYGDQVNQEGGWRLYCNGCHRYLDGAVSLSMMRSLEHPPLREEPPS